MATWRDRYNCNCEPGYFGTKCESDLITISIAKGKRSLKRGESIDVQLKITSYDGNVNVDVRNQNNVKIKSVTTSNISSSNPSTTLTINIGPIDVSSTTISYKFEAGPQGNNPSYSRMVTLTLVVIDLITISIAKGKRSLKRGESIDVQLKITSYDGNVIVDIINQDNVKIKSVTTSNISSSNPSTTLTINIGPIDVSSTTISYKFEAGPQGNNSSYSRMVTLTLVVIDACELSPCKNRATCQYSTAGPYYNCTCQPEYNGTTCEELKYTLNGNCKYHVNYYYQKTFSEANTTCNSLGGTVAMMKTDAIQDFVESQIIAQYGDRDDTISFWIGAHKSNTNWLWVDDTPITNGKWAWTAVSNGDGYLFMSSYATKRSNMKWVNNDGATTRGYVCEVPTVDLCSSNPCLFRGKCSSIGCQITCKCLNGFTGNNCETTPISISSTIVNYTTYMGESITVTLNIQSNHGPVRLQAFRNSNFNNVIFTKRNIISNVEIQLGSFLHHNTTIYTFRVDPEFNLDEYYISTAITVVVEAPDVVLAPTIVKSNKTGDVGILIPFPEERNGPISCLFLILVYKPNNTSNQWIKTLDDLANLSKTSVKENEAYIAFAMSRLDISDAQNRTILKNLGDDTVSSCIVNANINAVPTMRETITIVEMKGYNLKIADGAEYRKMSKNEDRKSVTIPRSKEAPTISPYETTVISNNVASSSRSEQIQPESPYTYDNDATHYEAPMSTIEKDENSKKTYENINPYENCDIKTDSDATKYEEVKPKR
uniref:uncharacterized protein LOC120336008 n=1 Tax=Styela clava TaxID=7725 RepID=UPI00193AC562|nr:uncharacterized protein LOC120336008 [Styela clava]